MRPGQRVSLLLSAALSAVLTGIVAFDIYVDWRVEGKPLWSTVGENSVPIVLGVLVFVGGYLVYRSSESLRLSTVTKWQYAGAVGLLVIAAEVVGLQLFQGELKPFLIVVQLTIGGAVAGTVVGLTSARRNAISAKRQHERDRFEALFENAPTETVEVEVDDGTPVVARFNDTFAQQFDVGEDVVGQPLFEVVTHGEESREKIQTAITAGETLETDVRTATADGQRDFQVRVVPLSVGAGAFLIYTDVTEIRNVQRELETTVDQLERSNDRLQQFAYVASHDLQEPLRMVSSYVSLLEDEYGDELDEEADEYIDFAVDGARRMQKMIDGLLAYSRVRTQGVEFSETDTNDIIEDTLKNLERLIERSGASVTTDELPAVEADRNQLGQVFQNLIENAIEHGGEGTSVHVGAERRDTEVVFSVADDGPGIPEAQQDRMFEIFEQGSRDDGGTGIGLAICDRIVSRHEGELWVESGDGEGATFKFTIPSA